MGGVHAATFLPKGFWPQPIPTSNPPLLVITPPPWVQQLSGISSGTFTAPPPRNKSISRHTHRPRGPGGRWQWCRLFLVPVRQCIYHLAIKKVRVKVTVKVRVKVTVRVNVRVRVRVRVRD